MRLKELTLPIAIIFTGICCFAAEEGAEKPVRLAGARPVIQAIHYTSIQDAIDALADEGGVVQLPPGEFVISEPLRVSKSDVTIEGTGTATHIRNVNEDGKSAIILQHPDGEDSRNSELWRIRLADLRITGNAKSGHGIEAIRINEIFIEGVTVSNHGGDGIRLYFCYEDPRICDSLITYNKATGLNLIGCHDIVVASNQFEENQDAVRCIDGFNLCMNGNNLDDHLGNGVVIENTYGSVVAGNMIEECKGTAIVLDRDCYGIALSANVIAHEETCGIDLKDAHGCTVSANVFTIIKNSALTIGPESGRITVTGNNFSNSYIGNDKIKRNANDAEAAGIILDNTSDITIVGNLLSGLTKSALSLSERRSKRIIFADNVLTDVDSQHEILKKSAGDSIVMDNLDSVK